MTDKEKLIARLNASFEMQYSKRGLITAQHTADDLMSYGVTFAKDTNVLTNGVTFETDRNVGSKWIPVTERLPDDDIPSARYLCYAKGYVRILKYWRMYKSFEYGGKPVKVTHWMPLPEPPKEV